MKIDFNSTYRELSRITKAALKVEDKPKLESKFPALLGSISPQESHNAEITKEILPRFDAVKRDPSPMASLRYSEPSMKVEQLGRLMPAEQEQPAVKEAAPRVKTPALLSARRVSEPEQEMAEEPRAALAPAAFTKTEAQYSRVIVEAGKKHGVDPSLSLAVAYNESSFNPKAVSRDGFESKGLFQLLDSTGKQLLERSGEQRPYDPFNPELNVNLGVSYLRYLHDLFSKENDLPNKLKTSAAANSSSLEKLAVAAFNAGEGRVASAQQRAQRAGMDPSVYEHVEPYLPDITKEYVKKVMRGKGEYEAKLIGS